VPDRGDFVGARIFRRVEPIIEVRAEGHLILPVQDRLDRRPQAQHVDASGQNEIEVERRQKARVFRSDSVVSIAAIG